MTFEGLVMLLGVMGGMFTVLGTVIGKWIDRRKTNAEADKTMADGYLVMVQSITRLVASIEKLTTSVDKRDARIDTLEAEIRDLRQSDADKDVVIASMKQDMARLVESNLSKNRRIKELSDKIDRWRIERDADRERITTLEGERETLLADIAKLQVSINDDTGTDNGKDVEQSAKSTQEIVKSEIAAAEKLD